MSLRSRHNWLVGIWFIYELFIEKKLANNIMEFSKFLSPIFGSILLFIGFYYLLFNSTEKKIKYIEEITAQDNLGNYLQVFIILMILNLEYFHPIGTIVEIGLYSICILLILVVIFKVWSTKKELLSGVVIGHLILGYIIFNWTKNNYARHFGDEIIGSYWAKPNFSAKYIVKISRSRDSNKEYNLPALVTVSLETHESGFAQEDRWGQEYNISYDKEYIVLEKVFFNNGGYLIFEDCDLEMGRKVHCTDQHYEDWYIELTEEKAK